MVLWQGGRVPNPTRPLSTRLARGAVAALAVLAVAACSPPESDPPAADPSGDSSLQSTPVGGPAPLCEYPTSGEPAKPVDPPSSDVETTGEVSVTLQTSEGPVSFTMDRSLVPCAAHSLESLAAQDYFDDTACHRLVDSGIFVLQCGDPTGTGRGGPGYSFADELTGSETYGAGTVAMANAGADTNGSQFFLVYDDSPLPPSYTVLGQMDEKSRGIVARIAAEGQDGSFGANGGGKPNNPAEITDVTVG